MKDLMGVNLRREDPVKYIKWAGFAREYHDWVIDEGDYVRWAKDPFSLEPSKFYPNNTYKWNPPYQDQTFVNFDQFYDEIQGAVGGSSRICATMKGCLPYLSGGDGAAYNEFKPVLSPISGAPRVYFLSKSGTAGSNNYTVTLQGSGGSGILEYANAANGIWQSSGIFSGLPVGIHVFMVRDSRNYRGVLVLSVEDQGAPNIPPTAVALTAPSCGNSNGIITINLPGNTYSLDGANFQTPNTFTGKGAGIYSLYVKSPSNLTAVRRVFLNSSSGLAANFVIQRKPDFDPSNPLGLIEIKASGGDGNYQYRINGGSWGSSNLFSPIAGAGYYTLEVKDGNNCQFAGEVTMQGASPINLPGPYSSPNSEDPASYTAYADWVHQFAMRFGPNADATSGNQLKFDPAEPANPLTGRNDVGYLEIWNEQDKKFYGGDFDAMTHFTPKEYAAMISAAFDGNKNAIRGMRPGFSNSCTPFTDGYCLGVNGLNIVMGGISEFAASDWTYFSDIESELVSLRGSSFLTVANFHHYSDNNWKGINFGGVGGVSPEADNDAIGGAPVTFKKRLEDLKSMASGKEMWLSEFGYDTNDSSPQRAQKIAANPNGENMAADRQETQARWMMRTFLTVASAGWKKAMQFCIRDANSAADTGGPGLFDASGLVKDKASGYSPKKSYYYVYTLSNVLGGSSFETDLTDAAYKYGTDYMHPRIYQFTGASGKILAAWLPSSNNEKKNHNITLPGTNITYATIIEPRQGDINGYRYKKNAPNGVLNIDLTEKPIFILPGVDGGDPTVSCPSFVTSQTLGISCDAVQVTWAFLSGVDHYLVYYYDKNDSEQSGNPMFDLGDPALKIYTDNLPGTSTSVTIAKLDKLDDNYQVFIIPVYANDVVPPIIDASCCMTTVKTAICHGGISSGDFASTSDACLKDILFNYEDVAFCYPQVNPIEKEWNDCGFNSSEFTITFTADYQIKAISLYDWADEGFFTVLYSTDGTNYPITQRILEYHTDYYDEWRTLPSEFTGNIKGLKFIRGRYVNGNLVVDTKANIKRILLYGHPNPGSPTQLLHCCGSGDASFTTVDNNNPQLGVNISSLNLAQNQAQHLIVGPNETLIINQAFTFGAGSHLYMMPGSGIQINGSNGNNGGISLSIISTTIEGCDQMWRGIALNPGNGFLSSSSTIRDADKALDVIRGAVGSTKTTFIIGSSNFEMNKYGIFMERSFSGTGDIHPFSFVQSTKFDGFGIDLKSPYSTQLDWWATPHSGILLNSAPLLKVTGSTTAPNIFRNMFNGIFSASSNLDVSASKFFNLKTGQIPNPYTGGTASFGGMGINAWDGWLAQTGFGNADNSPISFQKVERPIEMSYMYKFNITNNNMVEVDRAIRASLSRANPLNNTVQYNRLRTDHNGIELHFNTQPGIKVLNNNIATNDNTTTVAITALGFTSPLGTGGNTNSSDQVYDIRSNKIEIRSDIQNPDLLGAGIYVNDVKKANIEANEVTISNYIYQDGVPPKPGIYGIWQAHSTANTICSNTITGNTSKTGYGIVSEESTGYSMSCNTMDKVREALTFRGSCTSESGPATNNTWDKGVLGNTINNVHTGMVIEPSGMGMMADVGDQVRTGNKWFGPYDAWGIPGAGIAAQHLVPAQIGASEIRVNLISGIPELAPTLIDPNSGWFTYLNNTNYFNCGTNACLGNHLNIIRNPDGELYRKVAKGQLDFSPYAPAASWMLKRDVYADARALYSNTVTDPDYAAFFNSLASSSVKTFYDVDLAINDLATWEPGLRSQIGALEQDIANIITADMPALTSFQALLPATQFGQIMAGTAPALFAGLGAKMDSKAALEAQLKTSFDNRVAQIKAMNNALPSGQGYEQYEKTVNSIYLNSVSLDAWDLSDADLGTVQAIAAMCPNDAGFGVYKARSLYTAKSGQVREEWDDCGKAPVGHRKAVEKPNPSSSDVIRVNIYPNPAEDHLFLDISGQPTGRYRASLVSMQGTKLQVWEQGVGTIQIDCSQLPSGIYFLQVRDEKGKTVVQRFSLIK